MRFEDFLKQQLEDKEFADLWERSDPFFQAGDLLIKLRAHLGLSQEEIAAKSGLKRPYISRVESGDANPTVGTLGRILTAIGFRLKLDAEPSHFRRPTVAVIQINALVSAAASLLPLVPVQAGPVTVTYAPYHWRAGRAVSPIQMSVVVESHDLSIPPGEEVKPTCREPLPIL